jgi:hypothetical protein
MGMFDLVVTVERAYIQKCCNVMIVFDSAVEISLSDK